MDPNRILLPITARAWVNFRSGKGGDSAYWFIPLECTRKDKVTEIEEDRGQPCDEYVNTGYCPHTLSKKARQNKANIEKYNKYRMDLFHLAKHYNFQIPVAGMAVYYHFPCPKWWNKTKRLKMHGQMRLSKPDCSNLSKGLEDALTANDEAIGQTSGHGKFWFHPDKIEDALLKDGYIEILINQAIYNPYNVELINPHQTIEMEDIESRRQKRKERKAELDAQREQEKKVQRRRKPKPLKLLPQKKLFMKEDKIK